ncbi:MAG: PspA/IM30 family protein [Cyanobacteria bacterium SBLK]|nr:PspA/IM30 family protein [Cyanobacteria bacterium SBLK]
MELFDRVLRVVRSNVNSWISANEDPVLSLERTVDEMQRELVKLRQAVALAIATQKRTERQVAQNRVSAEDWYRRARIALTGGEEAIAREALTRRQNYQENAALLNRQIERQNEIILKLKQDLRLLEDRLSRVKMQKDMYLARATSAEATRRLHELLEKGVGKSTLNLLDRVEERVQDLEARAEVASQQNRNSLAGQFQPLETSAVVEAELAQLRQQINQQ